MNSKDILDVLREVFGRNLKAEVTSRWVRIPCPLAPWTHQKGRDNNPSAGISVSPSSTSVFTCFTCGNAAPFHAMLKRYAGFSGEDLGALVDELEEEAYMGPRQLPGWDEPRFAEGRELHPLDKAVFMDLYDPAAGHPYIASRGVDEETSGLLQLMVDPEDPQDGEERILFPVMGPDGALYGFTGRATNPGARLKVRDYHGLPKANCLLGAHLFQGPNRPEFVMVVEGLFDYANAWQCGYPAVAAMHGTLTEPQAQILRDIGLPVYLFYDNDDTGRKGTTEAAALLRQHLPVNRCGPYPKVKIEDDSAQGWHWLKDPGELLTEEFEDMINGSQVL